MNKIEKGLYSQFEKYCAVMACDIEGDKETEKCVNKVRGYHRACMDIANDILGYAMSSDFYDMMTVLRIKTINKIRSLERGDKE